MAIPKKYKKQLKAAMQGSQTVTTSSSGDKGVSRKMTWAFNIGDLVEHDGGCCFVLDDSRGDGWFELMTSDGRKWAKAKEIIKLQKLPAEAAAHAKAKSTKV